MCFLLFLWLCVFLEFPLVKSYKIFTAHRFQLDTNFKHTKSRLCKGSFFRFSQICVLYHCKKSGLTDLPEKRVPTKVKYLLPICQILRNFTEGNTRKFTVSFAFCAHVQLMSWNIQKHWCFSSNMHSLLNELLSSVCIWS